MIAHFVCRFPIVRSLLAGAVAGLPLVAASAAHAQGVIFDWGGEQKKADSGKQSIRFKGPGKPGDIIVSFGDRKLYFITGPGIAESFPIAIPREKSRWEGITSVSMKRENPSWTPTSTMLVENPKLPRWVPGGHPMNPLGNRALYLGSSDYRIHGTDAPWTIGTPASKGCVRMFNKDVADLYPRVKVGSKVTVTWQRFDGAVQVVADMPVSDAAAKANGAAPYAPGEVVNAPKPVVASYADEDDVALPRSKRRALQDGGVTNAPVEKVKATVQFEDDKPRRKRRDAEAEAQQDKVQRGDRVTKGEPAKLENLEPRSTSPSNDSKSEGKRVANLDAEKTASSGQSDKLARPARRERVAARTPQAERKPDTGPQSAEPVAKTAAVADPASPASSASVADRAVAAAERAALAAERAAAAAERALAAVERRNEAPAGTSTP
jgi:lipoprotein-anchoring transpeptidase ErfK/SrfK